MKGNCISRSIGIRLGDRAAQGELLGRAGAGICGRGYDERRSSVRLLDETSNSDETSKACDEERQREKGQNEAPLT